MFFSIIFKNLRLIYFLFFYGILLSKNHDMICYILFINMTILVGMIYMWNYKSYNPSFSVFSFLFLLHLVLKNTMETIKAHVLLPYVMFRCSKSSFFLYANQIIFILHLICSPSSISSFLFLCVKFQEIEIYYMGEVKHHMLIILSERNLSTCWCQQVMRMFVTNILENPK